MSLLKNIIAARKKLNEYTAAQTASDRTANHKRVAVNLKNWSDKLATVRLQCEVLKAAEAPVASPDNAPKLLTELATRFWKAHDSDPDSVLTITPDEWSKLPEYTKQISDAATERYTQLLSDLRGAPLPTLYTLLESGSGFPRTELARVREIDGILASLPKEPPADATKLTEARDLKKERDKLMDQLEKVVPDNVRGLLVKIEARTATLADVLPDELKWLQDKRLAPGFTINLATATLVPPGGGRR
jgi:hypothetical protein